MASVPVPPSVAMQAVQLRQDGNDYLTRERLGDAIEAYTAAITLCPDVAIYWMSRALCYWKRNEWDKVESDCRRALQLDSNFGRAHYMLGRALLVKHDYAGGIKELEKAMELERVAKPESYMVKRIWKALARAKYMEWEASSSRQASRLQNLREQCEDALAHYFFLDFLDGSNDDHCQQLEYFHEVFNKAGQPYTPSEVPDYLCCKITRDILCDPVITPSGITYERATLLDHLQRVGMFDPVTRQQLEPHQLVPNLAIKEAVQAFLSEHGWAYKLS